jgi:hypothetical protein
MNLGRPTFSLAKGILLLQRSTGSSFLPFPVLFCSLSLPTQEFLMAVPNGHSGTLPEQEASSMGKDALPLTQTGNALNLAPLPADGASAAAQMPVLLEEKSGPPVFPSPVKFSEIEIDHRPVGASTLKVVDYYADGRPVAAATLKVVDTWGEGRPTVASGAKFIHDPALNRPIMADGLKIAKTFMGNRPIEASPLKVLR